jgi:hypothetical protein
MSSFAWVWSPKRDGGDDDSREPGPVSRYTAVVKQDGDWWVGWVEEVPGVNAQESTREALLVSLKYVLQECRRRWR